MLADDHNLALSLGTEGEFSNVLNDFVFCGVQGGGEGELLQVADGDGQVRPVRFVVPAAGDPVSARVAVVQHWLIVELRVREPKLSGASLARMVSVSR